MTFFWLSYAVLWILVGALCVGMLLSYRYMAEVFVRGGKMRDAQGPEVGGSLDDQLTDLALQRRPGRSLLILFLTPGCGSCTRAMLAVRRYITNHPDHAEAAIILQASGKEYHDTVAKMSGSATVIADPKGEWRRRFQVFTTPFAISISASGTLLGKGQPKVDNDIAYLFRTWHEPRSGVSDTPPEVEVHTPNAERGSHESVRTVPG